MNISCEANNALTITILPFIVMFLCDHELRGA